MMQTRFKLTDPITRCKVITAAMLSAGLASAVTMYLTVREVSEDPLAEFERSKKYGYELERIGGKAALAADALYKWFAGLWHGQTLSYTIAVITILVASGYYFIATSLEVEAQEIRKQSPAPPS